MRYLLHCGEVRHVLSEALVNVGLERLHGTRVNLKKGQWEGEGDRRRNEKRRREIGKIPWQKRWRRLEWA